MTRLQEELDRFGGSLDGIIQKIEAGEDPTEEVKKLNRAAPWHLARMGFAATRDAIDRVNQEDQALLNE